jgi:hypoxanthine phosphoribosyltransferase
MFLDASGAACHRHAPISASSHVLLADDFTNSGSTLFGGADIIRKHAEPGVHVAAYVSHFVGKYDRSVVANFVTSLYDPKATLDFFHCTDSVAQTVAWLREEIEQRRAGGQPERCHVMGLAKAIADWVSTHQPADAKTSCGVA